MKRQGRVLFLILITSLIVLLNAAVVNGGSVPTYMNADAPADIPIDQRVNDLLARMTLAEKIGQMTLVEKNSLTPADVTQFAIGGVLSGGGGYPQPNNAESWAKMVDGFQQGALATRLAIPVIYGVDAIHGHNNLYGATIFPHEVGLGATRDADLVEKIGRATAQEMIATGIYWDYAPVVAVPQDIRWGRAYEAYGENTDLVSRLATAFITGLQGDGLGTPGSVMATPKHFVGDGGTTWGTSPFGPNNMDRGDTEVDEATLRAIHLPPYIAAIKAGAQSIMVSYSSWNGLQMHAQHYLLTDVLKGELGFSGFLVSDWQGIDQISGNYTTAVVTAINAGVDMNMVPQAYPRFIATLTDAVNKGDVSMDRIDDAVRRILRVKFEMGLFEHPLSDSSLLPTVGSAEHRALARQAVAESLVLLKNDDQTLPLSKDTATIDVAGQAANSIGLQSGGWTIEWQGSGNIALSLQPGTAALHVPSDDITPGTTILQGIENAVGSSAKVQYDPQGHFDGGQADVGIVVVGEHPYAEYQGDSARLNLSDSNKALIEQMRARSKKLIVVLISGRPLIVASALNTADAFVAAWLPGTEGEGIADVLFGDKPFQGKLPYTWPRTIDQIPFDFAHLATDSCAAPLFPYGYGLDATTISSPYLDLAAQCSAALPTAQVAAPATTEAQASPQPTAQPTQPEPTATPEISGTATVVINGNAVSSTEEATVQANSSTRDASQWTLAWSDEFDGAAGTPVDAANWTPEIGGSGWGNNELEYYTDRPENASMDGNGNLAIVARKENPANYDCHYGTCQYTSARLTTQAHEALTYGRIEARIKIPRGQGLWPAFWMLGSNIGQVGWPNSGEIDIMENIGKEPTTIHGTVHGPGYSGSSGITAAYKSDQAFADDFHVYAIEWDADAIRWYVDGTLYSTVSKKDLHGNTWVFDHNFFIILNVAVGGQWPGNPDTTSTFPQTMLVDYVRVYKLAK